MILYVFHNWLLHKWCLWLGGLTIIVEGTPQIIVQRCQITAGDQLIYDFLKPFGNIADILLYNFCEQKICSTWPDKGTATPCSFLKKKKANYISGPNPHQTGASAFQCMSAGFLRPNATILLVYIQSRQCFHLFKIHTQFSQTFALLYSVVHHIC